MFRFRSCQQMLPTDVATDVAHDDDTAKPRPRLQVSQPWHGASKSKPPKRGLWCSTKMSTRGKLQVPSSFTGFLNWYFTDIWVIFHNDLTWFCFRRCPVELQQCESCTKPSVLLKQHFLQDLITAKAVQSRVTSPLERRWSEKQVEWIRIDHQIMPNHAESHYLRRGLQLLSRNLLWISALQPAWSSWRIKLLTRLESVFLLYWIGTGKHA